MEKDIKLVGNVLHVGDTLINIPMSLKYKDLSEKEWSMFFDCVLDQQEQLAKVNEQIQKLSARNTELVEPLEKCPITRRDLFMVIDGKPTYGGPFDSYTIPVMQGKPDEKWHERELDVERFDHDEGAWVEDNTIPLRVISEDYLYELEEQLEGANERVRELEGQLQLTTITTHEAAFESDYGKKRLNKYAIDQQINALLWLLDKEIMEVDGNGVGYVDVVMPDSIERRIEQLRKEQSNDEYKNKTIYG